MIIIFYEKEHKPLAKKLTDYLRNNGFKVWTENFKTDNLSLDQAINKADAFVFIFSQDVNKSQKLIDFYDKIFETQKPIILYVVSDLEYSLSMQFLLDGNYWIDAYNSTFKESSKALLELLNNLSANKITVETTDNQVVSQEKQTKNKKTNLVAVFMLVLFALIIGIFFYVQKNTGSKKISGQSVIDTGFSLTSKQIVSNRSQLYEQYIVGKWRLVDYSDSQLEMMTPQQRQQIQPEIDRLKREFVFIFNSDHTFLRKGFVSGQTDRGYWQVDPQNNVLLIRPLNSKDFSRADRLAIKKLTQKDLVLVISSLDNAGNQVITILTLKKVE